MLLSTPSVLLASEMKAEGLLKEALAASARRLGRSEEDLLTALQANDAEAHSSFRYAIAKGLGGHLATLGSGVVALYVYGSTMDGGATSTSDIDLIVLVNRKIDPMRSLLRRMDAALVASYRRLLGDLRAPLSLLDAHLVDVEEERERCGYGAVLSSTRTCPVCLWRSPPRVTGAPLARGPHSPTLCLSARG
jgi:predicted nucleotidyltransferase